jgi:hypothetical protein
MFAYVQLVWYYPCFLFVLYTYMIAYSKAYRSGLINKQLFEIINQLTLNTIQKLMLLWYNVNRKLK